MQRRSRLMIGFIVVIACLLGGGGAAFRAHAASHPVSVQGWVTGQEMYRVNGKPFYAVQVLAGNHTSGWVTVNVGDYARLVADRAVTVTVRDGEIERVR